MWKQDLAVVVTEASTIKLLNEKQIKIYIFCTCLFMSSFRLAASVGIRNQIIYNLNFRGNALLFRNASVQYI